MANKYVDFALRFFKTEYESVSGILNKSEFLKSVMTGLMAGGGFLGVLSVVQTSLGSIITDPNALKTVNELISEATNKQWPLLAITIAGILLDGLRRTAQGTPAVIVPVPEDVKKKN